MKKKTKLYSYAKINLFLNIVSKRQDGYHNIESIMQTINIKDEIMLNIIDKGIIIKCDNKSIPTNSLNTAYKAAKILIDKFNIKNGIEIEIIKRIPNGAGMAGGSGNAAAVIIGMNQLFQLNMDTEKLIEIAMKIGADVPYCLFGGTYLAEGIGEKLTKLNDFTWDNILVVKPKIKISTRKAYNMIGKEMFNKYNIRNIIKSISDSDNNETILNCNNIFEDIAVKEHPEIKQIKDYMILNGAISSFMTGSGSAVIGFFRNKKSAVNVMNFFKEKYDEVYITETTREGIKNG